MGKWAFFDFAENKIFWHDFQVFFLLFQVAFGFFDSVWRDMSIKSVQCDLPARYQNSWNVRLRSDKFAQQEKKNVTPSLAAKKTTVCYCQKVLKSAPFFLWVPKEICQVWEIREVLPKHNCFCTRKQSEERKVGLQLWQISLDLFFQWKISNAIPSGI